MLERGQLSVFLSEPFMSFNIAHFLAEQARTQPMAIAVRAPHGREADGRIRYTEQTFFELDSESSAVAHYFSSKGIARGDRVLLMVRPGLDLIRIVFALFRLGAVPIVIDPGMGVKQFTRCVRHSGPKVLVGVRKAIWAGRLFRRSFRNVRIRIPVGGEFKRRIAGNDSSSAFPVVDSGSDEPAAILFTSGSTGPAKGVCYTHGMFRTQVEAIRTQYGIEPGEVDLPMLPVFALFNPALGMCTVVPEMNPARPATVSPDKIVRAIQQNGVTNSFGSPALWTKIARYCEVNSTRLPTIRRILIAGAPVSSALMRQMCSIIPNGEIHTPYGATEALPVSSIEAGEILKDTAARTQRGEGTCVGQALPGMEIRIIEPAEGAIASIDRVNELPPGRVGEIIVKAAWVSQSYDGLREANSRSKIADGVSYWHRMGDMGRLDEGGRIWFCGRKAERVLSTSGPMYTDCCEAIFNRHPKVFRSALIDLGGGRPGIVIEPEKNHMPRSRRARHEFIKSLKVLASGHALTAPIRHFFFQASFPVDVRHNAKIHRLSLARKFALR